MMDDDADGYGNEPELVLRPFGSHIRPESRIPLSSRIDSYHRLEPFPSCNRTRNCRKSVIKINLELKIHHCSGHHDAGSGKLIGESYVLRVVGLRLRRDILSSTMTPVRLQVRR